MNNKKLSELLFGKKNRKKTFSVILLLIVVFGMISGVKIWEKNYYTDAPADEDESIYENTVGVIRYNNEWYTLNENLETVLFIGIDKENVKIDERDFINNQQADFLMLAIIDNENKTVSALQINRDTIADVDVYGLGNAVVDTKKMQIALAHTYGSGGNDSCINTVNAVQNLLFGINIDHYVSLTMDAIQVLNDSVGGVTVHIDDDFSSVDKTLVQGTDVLLKGEHAVNFIRSRGNMKDSTNINRMNRQRVYLTSLYKKVSEMVKSDNTEQIYKSVANISDKMVTDYTVNQIDLAVNKYAEYTFTTFDTIEGVSVKGDEFMEFHADDEKLKDYVTGKFYIAQNRDEY